MVAAPLIPSVGCQMGGPNISQGAHLNIGMAHFGTEELNVAFEVADAGWGSGAGRGTASGAEVGAAIGAAVGAAVGAVVRAAVGAAVGAAAPEPPSGGPWKAETCTCRHSNSFSIPAVAFESLSTAGTGPSKEHKVLHRLLPVPSNEDGIQCWQAAAAAAAAAAGMHCRYTNCRWKVAGSTITRSRATHLLAAGGGGGGSTSG